MTRGPILSKVHSALFGFLVVLAAVLLLRLFGSGLNQAKTAASFDQPSFNPDQETKVSQLAEKTLASSVQLKDQAVPARNLFEESTEAVKRGLRLQSVRAEGPPVMYLGLMRVDDTNLIAQLNFHGRSYFVKPGDDVKDWKVVSIAEDSLILRNPEGVEETIPYRGGELKGKDLIAVIVREPKKETIELRAGDSIDGFEVREVGSESVTLTAEGREVVLRTGDEPVALGAAKTEEKTVERSTQTHEQNSQGPF